MKICDDHNGQINLRAKQKYEVLSATLCMDKTFSKNYIILPLKLTLNYIVLNYFLDTTCFSYASDNFIRVTCLRNRRLTAPNISAQLNQYREKMFQHPLWGEDSVRLAYMAELLSKIIVEEAKQFQKSSVGQGAQWLVNRAEELSLLDWGIKARNLWVK